MKTKINAEKTNSRETDTNLKIARLRLAKRVKHKETSFVSKHYNTAIFTALFFIFFLGFYLGWNFSDTSLKKTQIDFQNAQQDLNSLYLRLEFNKVVANSKPNKELLKSLSDTLYKTGIELDALDKSNKINTDNYIYLKKRYNINQVLYYIMFKKAKQQYNISTNIILFFFDSKNPKESEKQGEVLDNLVKKHDINILAMDYNYTKELNYFYSYYKIKKLPALVINYNTTLQGFRNESEIEKHIID